mmetsp:Transcript_21254/g.32012  ORF Transcript_21254/g.32012 Transcript_21254/m.32012 type:complete len:97 (+) Transcript_21254:130-420(+)
MCVGRSPFHSFSDRSKLLSPPPRANPPALDEKSTFQQCISLLQYSITIMFHLVLLDFEEEWFCPSLYGIVLFTFLSLWENFNDATHVVLHFIPPVL